MQEAGAVDASLTFRRRPRRTLPTALGQTTQRLKNSSLEYQLLVTTSQTARSRRTTAVSPSA